MQLDYSRKSFETNDLEFRLGDVQRNTLKNNKVVAALEYSLKNQNIIKVPSNQPQQITPGSDIVFRFDKAYLASNSYLNRCKMIADVDVKLTLTAASLNSQYPTYTASGTASAGFPAALVTKNGFDSRNSALEPFVINKLLTRREIDFSGKAIQSQSFLDPCEIDEISCLYNQDSLETLGIYPEKVRANSGYMAELYGSAPELPSFYDNLQSSLVSYANQNKYLINQPTYKRNNNGNYYYIKSSVYYTSAGVEVGGFTFTRNGQSQMSGKFQGSTPANILNSAETIFREPCPIISLTAAGITALGANGYQIITFAVEEDLISDLFTNIYVDKPRYYAMNSSELNFRFSQSAVPNQFFKTSNVSVNNVQVTLKSLDLQFSTFNLGTVQIPFFNYEIPFFIQTTNQIVSKPLLGVDGAYVGNVDFPVISYTTIPHYIKIDAFGNLNNTTGWQSITSNIAMSTLALQVDQDVGNSLQQMTMEELQRRTMANLGQWHQSWERTVRRMPVVANHIKFLTGTTLPANYLNSQYAADATSVTSSAPLVPFLLLRVGTDIRLAPGLEPGMRERVNMSFKIGFNQVYSNTNTPVVKITGYTLGKYIVSPVNGLLDTTEVSYSRDEWIRRVGEINSVISKQKESGTLDTWKQSYVLPDDMVLGGSWFTSLASKIGPAMSGLKNIANVASTVASHTGMLHPAMGTLGNVAKTAYNTIEKLGYGDPSHTMASARGRNVKYV